MYLFDKIMSLLCGDAVRIIRIRLVHWNLQWKFLNVAGVSVCAEMFSYTVGYSGVLHELQYNNLLSLSDARRSKRPRP